MLGSKTCWPPGERPSTPGAQPGRSNNQRWSIGRPRGPCCRGGAAAVRSGRDRAVREAEEASGASFGYGRLGLTRTIMLERGESQSLAEIYASEETGGKVKRAMRRG
jgi:hypothetical protein